LDIYDINNKIYTKTLFNSSIIFSISVFIFIFFIQILFGSGGLGGIGGGGIGGGGGGRYKGGGGGAY
jgi:hypothetical protein